MTTATISVLVSARRNSKYLAKFLHGFYTRTADRENTEILVMLNAGDIWNRELVDYYQKREPNIKFYFEDLQLGRGGLAAYFNMLYKHATGEWIAYFCEDHFIVMPAWDAYVRTVIQVNKLEARQVWCLIPKFDNVGAMSQIVSRGWCEALGGVLGRHGWIDSYINDVNELISAQERMIRFDEEMFHDFTHDKPEPMDPVHTTAALSEAGKALPPYDSAGTRQLIIDDAEKLTQAIALEKL